MSYFAPPLNTGVIATTLPVPGAMPWMTSNDMARLSRYRQYLAFDAGKHDVGRLGIGSAAVVANYAAVFVRKGASYLMPEPVGCSVDPPDDTDVGRAVALRCERALARVGDDNDLALADLATAIDAAVLGDGAFKVTWDAAAGRVQVAPVDPQSLYVECAPDNPRAVVTVRQYRETPAGGAPVGGAGLGYTGHMHGGAGAELEEWTAITYRRAVNGETVWEGANPYGCIPYVVFPNSPRPHDFWGESDLTHLIGLNGQLDRRLSVLASLLELEGNPVTILENVAGSAGIEVSPGAVWELPAGATARTLQLFGGDAADVHIRTIDAIYKALHDLAEMPRSAFGDATGVVSGTALEATLQPLIQPHAAQADHLDERAHATGAADPALARPLWRARSRRLHGGRPARAPRVGADHPRRPARARGGRDRPHPGGPARPRHGNGRPGRARRRPGSPRHRTRGGGGGLNRQDAKTPRKHKERENICICSSLIPLASWRLGGSTVFD